MDKRIAWAAWVIYSLIICAGIARGGMWLDEMQVWCLARDSNGLIDLFDLLRNEGHPPLWPLLVKPLTVFFDHPAAMAVLHSSFALGSAWLLLFCAPWPLLWRVLAVFGYFVLFEYAAMARNYGPGMFFLFAALATHRSGRARTASLFMMAIALTHYWGIVVAAVWALTMLSAPDRARGQQVWLFAVLLTCAVSLYSCIPQAALPYTPSLERVSLAALPDDIGRMLGQALLPFPDLAQLRPWNTNWLLNTAPLACVVMGFALLLAALWSTAGNKRWLLFLILSTLGILAFPVLAPFRSVRYYGPLVLALLTTLWMAPEAITGGKRYVVLLLLLLQIPGGIAISVAMLRTPRSMATASVAWLQRSEFADLPVMVHPYQAVPAVSGYLQRQVYCPATGSMVGHCRWTHTPFRLEREALLDTIAHAPFPRAIFCADDPSLAGVHGNLQLLPLGHFEPAMIGSEEHHLYLVQLRE